MAKKNSQPPHYCPTCGSRTDPGKKSFEGFMANLLSIAIRVSNNGEVLAEDVRTQSDAQNYARLGDLKYWGLLNQAPADWHYGKYTLTPFARSFARGAITIPQDVFVRRGYVVATSIKQIDFQTACGTNFNTIENWIKDWRDGI